MCQSSNITITVWLNRYALCRGDSMSYFQMSFEVTRYKNRYFSDDIKLRFMEFGQFFQAVFPILPKQMK